MKHIFFGLTRRYDGGSEPAISVNRGGVVLEVHKNQEGSTIYHRLGRLSQATIEWQPSKRYDSGRKPRIALNNHNIAFEVHEAPEKATLWFKLWEVMPDQVKVLRQGRYDDGFTPAVAMNDHGIVVEVHAATGGSNAKLWYQVWRVEGTSIQRLHKQQYDRGENPVIAINNSGAVFEMHRTTYRVGRFDGTKVVFSPGVRFGVNAVRPSVALTDDGLVIVNYRINTRLWHRTGKLSGEQIAWDDPVEYDIGGNTAVAAAGEMAVSVHGHLYGLWFSTSLIADRAAWMETDLATLGRMRLGDLVLPASHDSGMYTSSGHRTPWTKTQNLSILGQLRHGIRYFDLRPKWTGRKFVIAHGGFDGPDLSDVLDDIRKFADEGHQELAILKFSRFNNIHDPIIYGRMVEQIRASIGRWLVTSTPGNKRLADVTLSQYVAEGPAFIVVVDGPFPVNHRVPGFWVYRDWGSLSPDEGDLRVLDIYADTEWYNTMRDHQFGKFKNYDGTMAEAPKPLCDLFLLSWTLTPTITPVWELAKVANPHLAQDVRFGTPIPNGYGKIMNLLYVDYVEFARVTDVAVLQNREHAARAAEARLVKRRIAASPSTSAPARLPIKAKSSAKAKTPAKAKAGERTAKRAASDRE